MMKTENKDSVLILSNVIFPPFSVIYQPREQHPIDASNNRPIQIQIQTPKEIVPLERLWQSSSIEPQSEYKSGNDKPEETHEAEGNQEEDKRERKEEGEDEEDENGKDRLFQLNRLTYPNTDFQYQWNAINMQYDDKERKEEEILPCPKTSPCLSHAKRTVMRREQTQILSFVFRNRKLHSSIRQKEDRMEQKRILTHENTAERKRRRITQKTIYNLSIKYQIPESRVAPHALGSAQHNTMLEQLLYVKKCINEYGWMKAMLKSILLKYTRKEISKEIMYPQLNYLYLHMKKETQEKETLRKRQQQERIRQKLQFTLTKKILRDTISIKHGRRGKPHATHLFCDSHCPSKLHWRTKYGKRSKKFIDLTMVESIALQPTTPVLLRALKKKYIKEDACCLSLCAADRTLDMTFDSVLKRNWLFETLQRLRFDKK